MQLYVLACELLQHRSYPDFERTLRDLKAVPLMRSIWAVGTSLSAGELKRALRAVVGEYDRILVIEVREIGLAVGRRTIWRTCFGLRDDRLSLSGSNAGGARPPGRGSRVSPK